MFFIIALCGMALCGFVKALYLCEIPKFLCPRQILVDLS